MVKLDVRTAMFRAEGSGGLMITDIAALIGSLNFYLLERMPQTDSKAARIGAFTYPPNTSYAEIIFG